MELTLNPTFKDIQGQSWAIALDAPLIRRIRTRFGISLTDLAQDPFVRLDIDPLLMVDVLYALCEKQAHAASISEDEFGERIGNQLDAPRAALEDSIVNFSQSSKKSLVRSILEENKATRGEAMEQAMIQVKADRPAIVKAMAKESQRELRKHLASFGESSTEAEPSSISSTDAMPKPPATASLAP